MIQPISPDLLTQEVNGLKVEFEEEALSYIGKYNQMLLDMGMSPEDLRAEFDNIKQLRLQIIISNKNLEISFSKFL